MPVLIEHVIEVLAPDQGRAIRWDVTWSPFPYGVTLAEVDFDIASGASPEHAMLQVRFGDSPNSVPFRLFSTQDANALALLPKIPGARFDLTESARLAPGLKLAWSRPAGFETKVELVPSDEKAKGQQR